MTTLDRVVASDLASLGRDSASCTPTVQASLAIVDAKRMRPPRPVDGVADPARAYAVRVARLAGLAVAGAASALALQLHRAGIIDPDKCFINGYNHEGRLRGFVRIDCSGAPSYTDWHYSAVAVVVLTAIAYLAANALAVRMADRRTPPELQVLAARIAAARLARLATGGAGLLGIATILVIATNLFGFRSPSSCLEQDGCLDPLFLEPNLIAFAIVASMLIAKVIATELGSGGGGRAQSSWLDAGSTVVGITSFTALPTLFGILGFAVGNDWISFLDPRDAGDVYPDLGFAELLWRARVARDIELVALAILVVAATIGIACAREARLRQPSRWLRLLERPLTFALGLILGIVTLSIGARSDYCRYYGRSDDLELWQVALMVAGSLAMLLVVSMPILRRRRAEQDRTATA